MKNFLYLKYFLVTTIGLSAVFLPAACASPSLIAPTVEILAPPKNVYSIGELTVNVNISNFTIIDKQGQGAVAGEGHLHYFLDVTAPTTSGTPAVTAAGTYFSTADLSYTWTNIGTGHHTLSVELVNNDHAPLNPPVVATMDVLVIPELGPPAVVILSPRDLAAVPAGDVTINAQATNFILASGVAPRQGHLIYYMDATAPTNPGDPAYSNPGTYVVTTDTNYTWHNVQAGQHNFSIQLVNDDDTPLAPAIVAKISITMK
ncbi:MAG: hypothetical protein TUN42_04460 [Dehalogenimonas sp.]